VVEVFDLQESSPDDISPDMESQALFVKLKEVCDGAVVFQLCKKILMLFQTCQYITDLMLLQTCQMNYRFYVIPNMSIHYRFYMILNFA
jgi:hypothetical protein